MPWSHPSGHRENWAMILRNPELSWSPGWPPSRASQPVRQYHRKRKTARAANAMLSDNQMVFQATMLIFYPETDMWNILCKTSGFYNWQSPPSPAAGRWTRLDLLVYYSCPVVVICLDTLLCSQNMGFLKQDLCQMRYARPSRIGVRTQALKSRQTGAVLSFTFYLEQLLWTSISLL